MLSIAWSARRGVAPVVLLLSAAAIWMRADATAAPSAAPNRDGVATESAERLRSNSSTSPAGASDWIEVLSALPDEDCTFVFDRDAASVVIDRDHPAVPHLDIAPGKCPNKFKVVADDDDDDDEHGDDDDDDDDDDHHGDDDMACLVTNPFRMSVLGNGFDVTQVDLGTIGLSRVAANSPEDEMFGTSVLPVSFTFADKGTPFLGDLCGCHDLKGDGFLDLNLVFDKDEVIQAFGLANEPDGTVIQLRIFGRTGINRGFRIRDCITIVRHHD